MRNTAYTQSTALPAYPARESNTRAMLGKSSLIRPAWRQPRAYALRQASWTFKTIKSGFKSLSAPETHGKQGISLLETPRSIDSIEVPATKMVLDLKQIVSTHIVESHTHTLDTAVERVEKSIFPRSLDQARAYACYLIYQRH